MNKLISLALLIIYLIFIALAIFHLETSNAATNTIRIAIIDDGFNRDYARTLNGASELKICPNGSYDFITGLPTVGHHGRHGTIVGSLIANKLKDTDYCAVIYSVFADPTTDSKPSDIVRALVMALSEGYTAINMSYVGSTGFVLEEMLMRKLSLDGVKLFVAAGNGDRDLDKACTAFPACYHNVTNMVVVGSAQENGRKCRSSNYGKVVTIVTPGYLDSKWNEGDLCATSFATPRALSDYVSSLAVVPPKQIITQKPKAVCRRPSLDTKAGTVTCKGT